MLPPSWSEYCITSQRALSLWKKTGQYHYNDVIMGSIESQITSLTIVYSTVYSDADQRKHQSSASLVFVRGIHRGPVNSPHKWPVTRKKVSIWWRHHVKEFKWLSTSRFCFSGHGAMYVRNMIYAAQVTVDGVRMVVTDNLASLWRQAICNYDYEVSQSTYTRNSPILCATVLHTNKAHPTAGTESLCGHGAPLSLRNVWMSQ